jgi:hypothetical protein
MERRIVDTAREALHELEAFNASASKTTESDLLADLRPAVEQAASQATGSLAPQPELSELGSTGLAFHQSVLVSKRPTPLSL